jgi:uncharacterized Zn-binding protein involved in type VI secretion
MPKVARVGDRHICKKIDPGNKPHVGGRITAGAARVFVGGKPVAVVGSACGCQSPEPNAVAKGSQSVFVEGKRLVRVGDQTEHGGRVASGCRSVSAG